MAQGATQINCNTYVALLPYDMQDKIKKLVRRHFKREGYNKENINEIVNNVMDDRLNNVADIINIKQFYPC